MSTKIYSDKDVFTAAKERLDIIFTKFEKVYVSFSGGKDSGVLLNMALEAARRHGKLPLDVMVIDMEAQYAHTIEYVDRMMSHPDVNPYWICLPLHLRNAVSQIQPHWLCWDESCKEAWVRPLPKHRGMINDPDFFPFFRIGMEFEEFVPKFGEWLSEGKSTACLVGIRSDESLNRFRTIRNERKETFEGHMWTTHVTKSVYNAYPIYDWRTEDVWIASGKQGYDYNRIYDLMNLAGLTIHQMRLCQPYGDDQRKGLYLFKMLEPETWGKVVNRVEGANFGNRYAGDKALGNYKVQLPEGHTYRSYAKFLLSTMPPYLEEHYRKKIYKFLVWWKNHRHEFEMKGIPDHADAHLEAQKKVPSWRRVCKVLLKNDYWCKGLSFSQTKREMEHQVELITKYMEL